MAWKLRLCYLLLVSALCRSSRPPEDNFTLAESSSSLGSLSVEDDSEQELSSQLIEIDSRSNGWSAWSEWSSCSRSCDGGVSQQLRRCLIEGCRGEHVRHKICNMQACPESRDFREDQCAAFDSIPYEGTLFHWIPHYDEQDICSLTCKGKPTNFEREGEPVLVVAKLAEKVHDGTRCRLGSLDMCIDGKCQRVGCDLRIGSSKQVDACGVCGGDGTSCKRPLYHWTLASMSLCSTTCGGGYKMSRPLCQNRVSGEEVEEQLCNAAQKPDPTIVPCNTHSCPPKWYTGEWSACSATCGGGTKMRIVHCVEEANNTKIKIAEEKCTGHKPRYQEVCNQEDCPRWVTSSWSGCSVSCGEGIQVRVVECRDHKDHTSGLCSVLAKPPTSKTCSTGIQCPFHIDGSEELLPGLYHTQPLVQPYPPPPPAHAERLIGEQVVPSESTFIPDEWGPCSVTCGEGVRKREVHCKIFLEFSRTIAKLPDKQCSGPKPSETEKCYMEPCSLSSSSSSSSGSSSSSSLFASSSETNGDVKDDPYRQDSSLKVASGAAGKSYSWREEGFGHCSATCLGGVQELIVNCVRDDNQKVTPPYLCKRELKPEILIRTCNDHPCPPRWNYSDFQPCTQSCGIGIQTREVYCIHEVTRGGGNTVVVPNNMCPQPPPPDRQYCNVLDCPVRWRVSEWSKCTKTCGGGEKTRKVECKQVMAQNHTVDRPPSLCPSPKPPDRKPCNTKSCVVETDKPHIDVSNSTFIQHDHKKKKISLKIGGAATVFYGTIVKIKCPVKRFNRTRIQWAKDHNYLPLKSKKYKVSKKGALRVQNLTFKDRGVYTCIAGMSSADLTLSVRPKPGEFLNSEEIQKHGGFKNERVEGPLFPGTQAGEEANPAIFNDDHSHEQRPDAQRKKLQQKHRNPLFTPTLPSLKFDPSLNSLNAWPPQSTTQKSQNHKDNNNQENQDKSNLSKLPASSSVTVKPPPQIVKEASSSASRITPCITLLFFQLQYLWPFQNIMSSRGHRTIEFPPVKNNNNEEEHDFLLPYRPSDFRHQQRNFPFLGEDINEDDDEEEGSAVILGKGSPDNLIFEWQVGEWSPCSGNCGSLGYQMRQAHCTVKLDSTSQKVDKFLCEEAGLDVPETYRKCKQEDCPKWVTTRWTTCASSKCLKLNTAIQRRDIACMIGVNKTVVEVTKCLPNAKPPHKQECFSPKCIGKWKPGPWSDCTASCENQGVKYRVIECVWFGTKKSAAGACREKSRPPLMKICHGPPCNNNATVSSSCEDHSMFCPNVKKMNMCRLDHYKLQCCESCKQD